MTAFSALLSEKAGSSLNESKNVDIALFFIKEVILRYIFNFMAKVNKSLQTP
ncbi:hypothetical protein [Bacillus atrophaeus]|uniref:hypothetical protein n=1 Tax=Bacillus atrophaeus TaxID=1452 RepID=UPI002E1B55BA|nr:hypothetical protein [Bacillus atrophaeus]